MSTLPSSNAAALDRRWDAKLARRLVLPLCNTRVTPNHLTTVRLLIGAVAVLAFIPGSYAWSNIGALLFVASNFLDHTDGELARLAGKSSAWGHYYDLGSDAAVTIALFIAIGFGAAAGRATIKAPAVLDLPAPFLGAIVGASIALIFYLRMRIERMAGKSVSRQSRLGGFETEDVMYLLPLVALCDALPQLLFAALIGAPLFAFRVVIDYRRAVRCAQSRASACTSQVAP